MCFGRPLNNEYWTSECVLLMLMGGYIHFPSLKSGSVTFSSKSVFEVWGINLTVFIYFLVILIWVYLLSNSEKMFSKRLAFLLNVVCYNDLFNNKSFYERTF